MLMSVGAERAGGSLRGSASYWFPPDMVPRSANRNVLVCGEAGEPGRSETTD